MTKSITNNDLLTGKDITINVWNWKVLIDAEIGREIQKKHFTTSCNRQSAQRTQRKKLNLCVL